eukprot:8147232-Ditylum_brightwellii.AAC.1
MGPTGRLGSLVAPLVSQTTKFPPGHLATCQRSFVLLSLTHRRKLLICLRRSYSPKSDICQDLSYRRPDCILPRNQTQVNSHGAVCAYQLSYTQSLSCQHIK